jgi:Fe-S-cluster containining protein
MIKKNGSVAVISHPEFILSDNAITSIELANFYTPYQTVISGLGDKILKVKKFFRKELIAMRRRIRIDLSLKDESNHILELDFSVENVSVVAIVQPLQELYDKIIDVVVSKTEVACMKGCSRCCSQLIPCSIPEVGYLNNLLMNLSSINQDRIRGNFNFIAKVLKEKYAFNQLVDIYNNPDFDKIYFQLGMPCPFLEKNECSIYSQRPFVCREYHVRSLPFLCENPYNHRIERVYVGLNFGSLLTRLHTKLFGLPSLPIPLFYCMDWADKNKALLNTTFLTQEFFEGVLNCLERYNFKNTIFNSMHWRYIDENSANTNRILSDDRLFDEKSVNENNLSPLFLLLYNGCAIKSREMIRDLLREGAVIRNGSLLTPTQLPKLLTKHANADNVEKIFKSHYKDNPTLYDNEIVLEIGAGDGYLRYLMALNNDPTLKKISGKILETEASLEIVESNSAMGKYTVYASIDDLLKHFGKEFTPCVISMNVLDIFSYEKLRGELHCLYDVLKNDGYLIHIMSSSIHYCVFSDIIDLHPNKMYLPFYRNGYVGIRIASLQSNIKNNYHSLPNGPKELSDLFSQSPDKYIQFSYEIENWFENSGEDNKCVLLNEYSVGKITKAMEQSGFHIIVNKEIYSKRQVHCNKIHKEFEGVNTFHNKMGALITSSNGSIPKDAVLEESTFWVVSARKVN